MNYPKVGIFITPANLSDKQKVHDLLYSDDLFFDEENKGFFIGLKGSMRQSIYESITQQFIDNNINANVHICEPNHIEGIQFYND